LKKIAIQKKKAKKKQNNKELRRNRTQSFAITSNFSRADNEKRDENLFDNGNNRVSSQVWHVTNTRAVGVKKIVGLFERWGRTDNPNHDENEENPHRNETENTNGNENHGNESKTNEEDGSFKSKKKIKKEKNVKKFCKEIAL